MFIAPLGMLKCNSMYQKIDYDIFEYQEFVNKSFNKDLAVSVYWCVISDQWTVLFCIVHSSFCVFYNV